MDFNTFKRLLKAYPIIDRDLRCAVREVDDVICLTVDGVSHDIYSAEDLDKVNKGLLTDVFYLIQPITDVVGSAILAALSGHEPKDCGISILGIWRDTRVVRFETIDSPTVYLLDALSGNVYTMHVACPDGLHEIELRFLEDYDYKRLLISHMLMPHLLVDVPLGFDGCIKTEDNILLREHEDCDWKMYKKSVLGVINLAMDYAQMYDDANSQTKLFITNNDILNNIRQLIQTIPFLNKKGRKNSTVVSVGDATVITMKNSSRLIVLALFKDTYVVGYNCKSTAEIGVLAKAASSVLSDECEPDADDTINAYMEKLHIEHPVEEMTRLLRLCGQDAAIKAVCSFINDVM